MTEDQNPYLYSGNVGSPADDAEYFIWERLKTVGVIDKFPLLDSEWREIIDESIAALEVNNLRIISKRLFENLSAQ